MGSLSPLGLAPWQIPVGMYTYGGFARELGSMKEGLADPALA